MGTCVAYYLLKHGIKSTIIERHKIACGASGKAGGFLAKDWCSEKHLSEFAEQSFDLHSELSEFHNGTEKYDYRSVDAYSIDINNGSGNKSKCLAWFDGKCVDFKSCRQIGTKQTCAQLHPYKFVSTLTEYNLANGVKIVENQCVKELKFNEDKSQVNGVALESGRILDCDVIIVAMGPWSGLFSDLLKLDISVSGQKAHSILITPSREIPAESVFTDFGEFSPEFYPRPRNEMYVCGLAENPISSEALPSPDQVKPTEGSCEKVHEMSSSFSSVLKSGRCTMSQACYMPLTQDGLPLIGKLTQSCYIATGHGCWGILNAPATGKSLAGLIVNGTPGDIDITGFNPLRFDK